MNAIQVSSLTKSFDQTQADKCSPPSDTQPHLECAAMISDSGVPSLPQLWDHPIGPVLLASDDKKSRKEEFNENF